MLAAVVAGASDRANMAHRNKNLLEAFTASAARDKAGADAPGSEASSAVGGPFASPPVQESILTPAERELVKDAASGPPQLARNLMRPENFPGLVAGVVILVAISFLLGRATGGGVTAAAAESTEPAAPATIGGASGGTAPVLAATPIPLPGSNGDVRQRSSAEGDRAETAEAIRINAMMSQLQDPENQYTVKVVEYVRPKDEEFANATFYYLLDQGLPVGMLSRGKRLYIVLGAASRQVDLDELLKHAKVMDGPPPRNKSAEFFDAYLEKIDNLLDRE